MDMLTLIKKPLITEKSSTEREKYNKYTFVVDRKATKGQIKQAVQEQFKVTVTNVNTAVMPGKVRRMGKYSGVRADWKKAIVTVQKGQEIKLVEGV